MQKYLILIFMLITLGGYAQDRRNAPVRNDSLRLKEYNHVISFLKLGEIAAGRFMAIEKDWERRMDSVNRLRLLREERSGVITALEQAHADSLQKIFSGDEFNAYMARRDSVRARYGRLRASRTRQNN